MNHLFECEQFILYNNEDSNLNKVHINIQQRNGRKFISIIQGLDQNLDIKKLLKAFKKNFNCNGSIVIGDNSNKIIQLSGDQRINIKKFLTENEIYNDNQIQLHGF